MILTNATVLLVTGLVGREGDAAIAGYGIGSRLGIHARADQLRYRCTAHRAGRHQYRRPPIRRAQRVAWVGALMAGAIAAAIGAVVAIWPDLWLGLFTNDPGALASGRTYLHIVGPVYGFFGLAMALYFASQGNRRDGGGW